MSATTSDREMSGAKRRAASYSSQCDESRPQRIARSYVKNKKLVIPSNCR